MKTKKLVYGAIIAAIYSALTILLAPLGTVFQVRIAEALTVLPAVTPAAIWGLFTGCLIANIFTGGGILDIIFGSITTLFAAYFSNRLRNNKWLVPLPPIILNSVIVGGYLTYSYGGVLLLNMLTVGVGQLVSCYLLGMPLLMIIKDKEILK